MATPTPSGYSARVSFVLLAGDQRFVPAQIGGGRIIFDRDVILPGTTGELIAHIDENRQHWQLTWEASELPRRRVEAEYRELEYTSAPGETTHEKRAAG